MTEAQKTVIQISFDTRTKEHNTLRQTPLGRRTQEQKGSLWSTGGVLGELGGPRELREFTVEFTVVG